jgi:peroxiredoxin
MKGVSKRAAFVVDVDGTVLYRWVSEDSDQLPPFEDIKGSVEWGRYLTTP